MFIIGIILAVLALGGLATYFIARSDEAKGAGISAFALGLLLAVISVVIASMSTVPTRNVGIVTQFNKQTDRTTGAGLQWHAPWQDVDDWDASGNSYNRLGDGCLWVAIAAQRKACIPLQVEYRAAIKRAPENWAAYREVDGKSRFEVFVDRRVTPQIDSAVASVFAGFDPLSTVDPASGDAPAPDLNKAYKQKLTDAINVAIGGGSVQGNGSVLLSPDAETKEDPEADVVVLTVAFQSPRYDEATQKQIDAYGQKILEARNLTIDKANAITRADITKTDASVDQVARCLQIAEKLGKEPGLCMGAGVTTTRPIG